MKNENKPTVEKLAKINPEIIEPVSPSETKNATADAKPKVDEPEEGIALCLSGGGYRAMLFHAGTLWRLNEMALLPKLKRISSVSGGSITAGVLAMKWNDLNFQNDVAQNFEKEIIKPIKSLASRTIDVSSVLTGSLWFGTVGDKVADSYEKYLYGDKTLQDMPDEPRFVINATNVQSGVLWRFMKPYMRDWRVGEVKNPKVKLATAVAASSAFPPVLSPVELNLDPDDFTPNSGTDLQDDSYRTQVVLTDGGVYDNLGLETAWKRYKTILVSDAGGGFSAEADPEGDWVRHSVRVLFLIDNQVRSLRHRQLIESYKAGIRNGAFWDIGHNLKETFDLDDALPCPFEKTHTLANITTRLKKLDKNLQNKLINWGYAIADASIRKYTNLASTSPTPEFPFSNEGVG